MSGVAADWRPDPAALAAFLRRRGLRVGTGEMLRAMGLLDRLAIFGSQPKTPEQAANWLAPVLCNTARHQAALPTWLREFDQLAKPERKTGDAPMDIKPSPPSRRPLWLSCAALAVVVLVSTGLLFLPNLPFTTVTPAAELTGPVPLAPDSASGSPTWIAWLSRFYAAIPAALVPPLAALTYIRWRGPDVPVLARAAFHPASLAQLATINQTPLLFAGRDITEALRGLRTHRQVPDPRPDLRASVRATLASAGRPVLASGSRPRMPEYPLLVETLSSRDHLPALAQLLANRLQDEAVHHTVYEYGVDPLRLRDAKGGTLTLPDIAARYDHDVLLMLGDGDSLIDPVQLTLLAWTESLAAWRAAILLTPIPRVRWSWRERRLAEGGIIVLPMTSDGLARMAEFLRAGTRHPRLAFERPPTRPGLIAREGRHAFCFHTDEVPTAGEREAILDAILQEIPGPAFELLSLSALFPECRPDITLHLGREFGLLADEAFGALSALPWLRYGRLPDWLRLDLVQTLSEEQLDKARHVLRDWIGTEKAHGAAGLWIATAGPSGTTSTFPKQKPIRDVIYLRLARRESLATLDLEAHRNLETLAHQNWRAPKTLATLAGAIGCVVTLVTLIAAGAATPVGSKGPRPAAPASTNASSAPASSLDDGATVSPDAIKNVESGKPAPVSAPSSPRLPQRQTKSPKAGQ